MCRVVAPVGRERELRAEVDAFNHGAVFESWDMVCGRLAPELGGSRAHLGVLGLNYYWTNQWELGRADEPLAGDDPRRVPLAEIIRDTWLRYGGRVLVTETSHVDDARAGWIEELTNAVHALRAECVPIAGVCLYPILGMPEWHEPTTWTRMGLWDCILGGRDLNRVVHSPMLEALRLAQQLDAGRARSFGRELRRRAPERATA
jgi:hypothetical protein